MPEVKVLLIDPNFDKDKIDQWIPLGLSYIASMLLNEGIEVDGYCFSVDRIPKEKFKTYNVFGIYCSIIDFKKACYIAKLIKNFNPNSFIVMGGPLPSIMPEKVIYQEGVDCIVVGEGEYTMKELVLSIRNKEDISDIDGIMFKKNDKIIKTAKRPTFQNLDKLPFPSREIFDHNRYNGNPYRSIITSRGCPYNCANCKPALDLISKYRKRTVENVLAEIEFLMDKHHVKDFVMLDSVFFTSKKWFNDFYRIVKDRNMRFQFSCSLRIDNVDEKILGDMKEIGCSKISFGVESGSQRVIDELLNKNIPLFQVDSILKKATNLGIDTHIFFMLGIPGERWHEVMQTIKIAVSIKSGVKERHIALPWPGTRFYELAKKEGWLISDEFENYCTSFYRSYVPVIRTPFLTIAQVKQSLKIFDRMLIIKGYIPRKWLLHDIDTQFWSLPYLLKHITFGRIIELRYIFKIIILAMINHIRGLMHN